MSCFQLLGTLFNEDCEKTMLKISDNFIDLTLTSPPYDNLRKYSGYNYNLENIVSQLFRITKPGGVIVWIAGDATYNGNETGTSFKQALFFQESGFNLFDTMIYAKMPRGAVGNNTIAYFILVQ